MKRKKEWWALCFTGIFLLALFIAGLDQYTRAGTEGLTAENGIGEMTAGHRYTQKFTCRTGPLEAVEVHLATFWRTNDSRLTVRLLEDGTERQRWLIDCRKLEDSAYYTLRLGERIEDPQGKAYELEFTTDAAPGSGVTVYANQSAGEGGYAVDGEEVPGVSLCYRLDYRRAAWNPYTILGLLFVPSAVALLLTAMRIGEKGDGSPAGKAGRKNAETQAGNVDGKNAEIAAVRPSRRIERQFLLLWVAFSLMFALSNTLFNVPDEAAHFYRAFEVAQGHAVSVFHPSTFEVGRELPIEGNLWLDVFRESWDSFWQHAGIRESQTLSFRSFFNTALYAPLSYIPQASGIAIARLFTDRLVVIAYAGRMANWLCITALSYAALCLVPRGKAFFCLFLLMPMSLQEGFSLAPDGMVVAIAVLMTALVMYLREIHRGKLRTFQLGLLYLLALLISLYKIVYMPLCLLYVLIPARKFGGKRQKAVHAAVMAVLAVGLNLWWLSLCGDFLIKKGADSALQTSFILSHPLQYALVLLRTLIEGAGSWLEGMVGYSLAWLNVYLPKILVYAFLFRLAAGIKMEWGRKADCGRKPDRTVRFDRAILFFMIASVIVLICTSLYVQWTPPYRPSSEGIQGRYFIALLAPLYMALNLNSPQQVRGENGEGRMEICDLAISVMINGSACILLLFSCIAG